MFFWSGLPYVRFVLCFITGIILAMHFQLPESSMLIISTISILIYGFLWAKKNSWLLLKNHIYGLIISLILIWFGYLRYVSDVKSNDALFSNSTKGLIYELISSAEIRGKNSRYTARLVKQNSEEWKESNGRVLLYIQDTISTLTYGSHILTDIVPSEISEPKNPEEFNYKQYLSNQHIQYQCFLKSGDYQYIDSGGKESLMKYATEWRLYFEETIEKFVKDSQAKSIVKALLLGVKDDLSPETKVVFSMAGAMHILAVSGLHVGVVYGLLFLLLTWHPKMKNRLLFVASITIPVLWFYAMITGMSPSVLRAVTMFTIMELAKVLNRRSDKYNNLAITAMILLVIDPLQINSVGFQLSFMAVLGILYLYPRLSKLIIFENKIIRAVWNLSCVSIAAQVATFPLALYYFHSFPTYFLLSNLVAIPLAVLVVWVGIFMLAFGSVIPIIGTAIGNTLSWIVGITVQLLSTLNKIPGSNISGVYLEYWQLWSLYIASLFIVLWFVYSKKLHLFIGLVVLSVLFGSKVWSVVTNNDQQQIVFYSIYNHWAIDLFSNGRVRHFSDADLHRDPKKISYHIEPYRLKINAELFSNHNVHSKVLEGATFIVWQGKSILVIEDSKFKTGENISVDFLLLSPTAYLKQPPQKIKYGQLIHSGRNKIQEHHNLNKEGALIVNL